MLAGDYYFDEKDFEKAKSYYEKGLERVIATTQERNHMLDRLQKCNDAL